MDLQAEEMFQRIISEESHNEPSDNGKPEDLILKLPPWFDEKQFKRGQNLFNKYYFGFMVSYAIGLTGVLAIPSILQILVSTNKSSSPRTAFRRYWSTFKHIASWSQYELKPGSVSWRSLYTVRSRHLQAGRAAALKGFGTVSQRDIVLTLFGFIGNSLLQPDQFGIFQTEDGEWEGFNHFWRVISNMMGLQDRYNICKGTVEQTRRVCQLLQDNIFTPCLDNPPEYFEHMARMASSGIAVFFPPAENTGMIYFTKRLAGVPGYVNSEAARIALRQKLMILSKGDPDIGVKTTDIIKKCVIEGLSQRESRLIYPRDHDSLVTPPQYKRLPTATKFKLALANILVHFYSTEIGRVLLNFYLHWNVFIATYLPYFVIWKFGYRDAYSSMFKEDPVDYEIPKPNSEYYKPLPHEPWYKIMLDIMF